MMVTVASSLDSWHSSCHAGPGLAFSCRLEYSHGSSHKWPSAPSRCSYWQRSYMSDNTNTHCCRQRSGNLRPCCQRDGPLSRWDTAAWPFDSSTACRNYAKCRLSSSSSNWPAWPRLVVDTPVAVVARLGAFETRL
jgi:hypothetical protein